MIPVAAATSSPAAISTEDLLDAQQIARLLGCTTSMLTYHCTHKQFPPPVAKRGNAHLYRRSDVEGWIKKKNRESEDLLDAPQICRLLGCTLGMFKYHCRTNDFPPAAGKRGRSKTYRRSEVEAWIKSRAAAKAKQLGEPKRTCSNCGDGHVVGRILICRLEGGPHRNTSRKPGDTCDHHTRPGSYRPVPTEQGDD